ncbi:hypothetical protein [Streptomyces sp. NPDC051684]|uniref:hypothetical protein n=1 Tax=Streptomyces sp. NPDC051684 TaxID=3365670 RepID=UPI003793F74C
MTRTTATLLAATGLAVSAGFAGAAPASAQEYPEGPFAVVSVPEPTQCVAALRVDNSGAHTQQLPGTENCAPTDPNHKWTYDAATQQLRNVGRNECVWNRTLPDGTHRVVFRGCKDAALVQDNQKWTATDDKHIESAVGGCMVLEPKASVIAVEDCADDDAQQDTSLVPVR